MDLRDPIWQGFEAVITIVGVLLTAIFIVIPGFREWLIRTIRSSYVWLVLFLLIITCFCLAIIPPTTRGVISLLATSTPTLTVTPSPTPIPTSTSTPTPSYTNLLYDNFDNGPSPSWSPVSGTWQMVNNQYTITNVLSETEWGLGRNFVGDSAWTNYQMGANVYLENIEPRINIAYIIVRAQDTDNFLALEIRDFDLFDSDWSRGTWYIVQNGNWTEKPAASFLSPMVTNFSVEIQVQQDIITTFIDGTQVSRWGEAPYLNGMVGIGVASRYPTHPASFDNFFVRTQP